MLIASKWQQAFSENYVCCHIPMTSAASSPLPFTSVLSHISSQPPREQTASVLVPSEPSVCCLARHKANRTGCCSTYATAFLH